MAVRMARLMPQKILTTAKWMALLRKPRKAKPVAQQPTILIAAAAASKTDVMGYHDAREIPNYWALAQNFVLQDNLFEPNASWSLPAHFFMVSEWSAKCSIAQRSDELHQCIAVPGKPS